jgi:micrococcal nuclease
VTDPRFDTCTEAKKNGYGPYNVGSDPEYDWYDDRDNDGVVCE